MSPREEEEFELILGNKQLLSLFFLVVVLFGVFFSFGYTVGYGRGENSRTREVAAAEPVDEPAGKVQLPATLLEDAPKTPEPSPEPETPPVVAQTVPAKEKPNPATQPLSKAEPPPPRSSPPPAPAPPASSASADGPLHLQISAVRVEKDAEAFVQQLRSKGHPASVSNRGDGWYRIIVGPFNDEAAASAYQKRLRADGVESLLRRR
jgi:cell division protein FtsN